MILLAFHEFLSEFLHIYRGGSLGSEVFLGTQKFRFLTHKSNIFGKWQNYFFRKWRFLPLRRRKLTLNKVGMLDRVHMLEKGSNDPSAHFHNLILGKLAISAKRS